MVQKVMNGVLPMPPRMALSIHLLTDCDIARDSRGRLVILATRNRKPYAPFDDEDPRVRFAWDSPTGLSALTASSELIMRAAQKRGTLPILLADLAEVLGRHAKNLKPMLARELCSENLGLENSDQEVVLNLVTIDPFRAGLELNLRKGTTRRRERRSRVGKAFHWPGSRRKG
jgi:hypothetical protein